MKKMIKRACLAVLVCGLIPAAAFAGPCIPGSLASYITLGATGCTIGASQFFNFTNLPVLGGASIIQDSSFFVNPLGVSTPGFRFDVDTDADPNSIFERRIGYSISGPGFIGNKVFLTGNSVLTDAAVTVVERLCLGAAFGPGESCGAIEPSPLAPFDLGLLGQSTSESTTFPNKTSLGVIVDITVDGGTDGHAALGSATTQFTPAAVPAVPESPMLSFVAIGLVTGLAGLRARRSNSPQF